MAVILLNPDERYPKGNGEGTIGPLLMTSTAAGSFSVMFWGMIHLMEGTDDEWQREKINACLDLARDFAEEVGIDL